MIKLLQWFCSKWVVWWYIFSKEKERKDKNSLTKSEKKREAKKRHEEKAEKQSRRSKENDGYHEEKVPKEKRMEERVHERRYSKEPERKDEERSSSVASNNSSHGSHVHRRSAEPSPKQGDERGHNQLLIILYIYKYSCLLNFVHNGIYLKLGNIQA